MSLLSDLSTEWERLTTLAAQQEWLVFLNAGGIQEVRFPDHAVAPPVGARISVSIQRHNSRQ
jgi:hypothetical protein